MVVAGVLPRAATAVKQAANRFTSNGRKGEQRMNTINAEDGTQSLFQGWAAAARGFSAMVGRHLGCFEDQMCISRRADIAGGGRRA